jgi:hypothetical protein
MTHLNKNIIPFLLLPIVLFFFHSTYNFNSKIINSIKIYNIIKLDLSIFLKGHLAIVLSYI